MDSKDPVESRIWKAVSFYAYAVFGIFLLVTPWTPVWEQAVRTLLPISLENWMVRGWARGTVSAVGVLDLVVALQFGTALWARSGEDRS